MGDKEREGKDGRVNTGEDVCGRGEREGEDGAEDEERMPDEGVVVEEREGEERRGESEDGN